MTRKISVNIVFQQWLAGLAVALLNLQSGLMFGWTSPAMARLTAPDSSIPLDSEQASWVSSLLMFGSLFGAVLGPVINMYLGSKCSISVTLFPIAIGWIIIAFANSVEWLYAARLLSGLSDGMIFSIFPLYIGEIAIPKMRGGLMSLASFGCLIGQVVASICGSHWSLFTTSLFYLACSLICMIIFFCLPESPHHLVKVGQQKAAKKSIHWYRAGKDVETEFQAVEKFVNTKKTVKFISMLQEFKSPAIRRATVQIILLVTFAEISGLNTIVLYMETILSKTNFTLITPSDIVIYVNVIGLFGSGLSIFLMDSCGRKFLLLISSIGVTLSMISLMVYFLLVDLEKDTTNVEWLPMASMFLFAITFVIGLKPIPISIKGEIFPANFKCIASCIATLISSGMAFFISKSYLPMIDLMGEAFVFLLHALGTSLVIPYVLFLMPETKGKSLLQIQDEFINK